MRKTAVQNRLDKIRILQEEIRDIQAKCVHPKETLKAVDKGSTGGWDPDTYWTEFTCGKCQKHWHMDKP